MIRTFWEMVAVISSLGGAGLLACLPRDLDKRRLAIAICLMMLGINLAGWYRHLQFSSTTEWNTAQSWEWSRLFSSDDLTASILPIMSLLHVLVLVATPPAKANRISYSRLVLGLAVLEATLCCRTSWLLVTLLSFQVTLPWFEIRSRGGRSSLYFTYMLLFCVTLGIGWGIWSRTSSDSALHWLSFPLILTSIAIRSGIFPFHSWVPELTQEIGFGSAILFLMPMVGTYATIRLLLPVAPEWTLRLMAVVSLGTALYASGLACVQRDARRFFSYIFLSHASLVTVGLEMVTPVSLTGALCLWSSVCLSLGGFGLTLRAIEARAGRLQLTHYLGLSEQIPKLASLFILTGLASIGFPGTSGFIGTEMLVDGVVQVYPIVGACVAIVAALNSISIIKVYFRIFTGKQPRDAVTLSCRLGERAAVGIITAVIIGGGLFPQLGMNTHFRAAEGLMTQRRKSNDLRLEAFERSEPGTDRENRRADPSQHRQDPAEDQHAGNTPPKLTARHAAANP